MPALINSWRLISGSQASECGFNKTSPSCRIECLVLHSSMVLPVFKAGFRSANAKGRIGYGFILMACEKFIVSFLALFSTPSVSPPHPGERRGRHGFPARNDIEALICRSYKPCSLAKDSLEWDIAALSASLSVRFVCPLFQSLFKVAFALFYFGDLLWINRQPYFSPRKPHSHSPVRFCRIPQDAGAFR